MPSSFAVLHFRKAVTASPSRTSTWERAWLQCIGSSNEGETLEVLQVFVGALTHTSTWDSPVGRLHLGWVLGRMAQYLLHEAHWECRNGQSNVSFGTSVKRLSVWAERMSGGNFGMPVKRQRGATDQNGGVFQMFPEYGLPHWQLSNLDPNGRLHSSWVWLLPMRGPMLSRLRREPYFSGTCVPDLTNPAPIWNNFKVFNPFNEYHCNRNERKWLSGWCFMRISAIFPRKSPH